MLTLPGVRRASFPQRRGERGRLCAHPPGTSHSFAAHSGAWYLSLQDIASTPFFPDGRAVEVACQGRVQCFNAMLFGVVASL